MSTVLIPAQGLLAVDWDAERLNGISAFIEATPVDGGWSLSLILKKSEVQVRSQMDQIFTSPTLPPTVLLYFRPHRDNIIAIVYGTTIATVLDSESAKQIFPPASRSRARVPIAVRPVVH